MKYSVSSCNRKRNASKFILTCCVFLFLNLFFGVKISASTNVAIIGSTHMGNGDNNSVVTYSYERGTNTYNSYFIQGTGVSNKDGINLRIDDLFNGDGLDSFDSFTLWEHGFTSGAGPLQDYDRWFVGKITCTPDMSATPLPLCEKEKDDARTRYGDRIGKGWIGNGTREDIFAVYNGKLYFFYADVNNHDNADDVTTTVNFMNVFSTSNPYITYTYRIRNATGLSGNGFGYKKVLVNFWKAAVDGSNAVNSDTNILRFIEINFGLARTIDSFNSNSDFITNRNDSSDFSCDDANNKDKICVDYKDTGGLPQAITTVSKDVNIYLPKSVVYEHKSVTRADVISNYVSGKPDMNYVNSNNSLYALNYFCERDDVDTVTDSEFNNSNTCDGANAYMREYLYVEAKKASGSQDIVDAYRLDALDPNFVLDRYHITIEVDTRGSYVLVIRDVFGNVNRNIIFDVNDILNRAIVTYFEKSNKTNEVVAESDGWIADEYLTNDDVIVTLTMSATTIINMGLPIVPAETTLLDATHVKKVEYWRVEFDATTTYSGDLCTGDDTSTCALKPTDASKIKSLYDISKSPVEGSEFVGFEQNKIRARILSNGRYRFYIELYSGNNTNTNRGATKNPAVEVYKIDKSEPYIYINNGLNSCMEDDCEYEEATFPYYRGTGSVNGSTISKLESGIPTDLIGPYNITYTNNTIYYPSANGEDSLLGNENDIFFEYLTFLVNSKFRVNEVLHYYDDSQVIYSYYNVDNASNTMKYTKVSNSFETDEQTYREYILTNNIKYTAFSLAMNKDTSLVVTDRVDEDYDYMKIEYYDAIDTSKTVCEMLASLVVDFNGDDNLEDKQECVNYYLDHGLSFRVKITVRDIVQDLNDGSYILGNTSEHIISVKVNDTTTPGYSSIINNYNIGSECRIEVGNHIGGISIDTQNKDMLLNCYGILNSDNTTNIEDNVFEGISRNNIVNDKNHVSMYLLNRKTGMWVDASIGYKPDRSGNYVVLFIIRDNANKTTTFNYNGRVFYEGEDTEVTVNSDNALISVDGNAIALLASYYVDKKNIVITPYKDNNGISAYKYYADNDPTFHYCVSVNQNTTGIRAYLEEPFKDMSLFTNVGCSNAITPIQSSDIFGEDSVASLAGALSRQESGEYNRLRNSMSDPDANEYVGVYYVVLGDLRVSGVDDGHDVSKDYIVKIDPRTRVSGNRLYGNNRNGSRKNALNTSIVDGEIVTDGDEAKENDSYFVESNAIFVIRQIVLKVSANGDSKVFGTQDYGYGLALNNDTNNSYLRGYRYGATTIETIDGEAPDLIASISVEAIVNGTLRRQLGENVGLYSICNYRGDSVEDTSLEETVNMYVIGTSLCSDYDMGVNIDITTASYTNEGIMIIDEAYIKSRALYITPNYYVNNFYTLNSVDSSVDRDNNHANFVIKYESNEFKITPNTLIVQPTPGQRREYSRAGVDEVNPWEVIVYNEMVKTRTENDNTFNGYTVNITKASNVSENDSQSIDTYPIIEGQPVYANASEERDVWKIIIGGITYTGEKVNETYSLFASSRIGLKDWNATSGRFIGMEAGWYEFDPSKILIIANNGNTTCDANNVVDKNNTLPCKNYNIVMDYTYRNNDGMEASEYKGKLGYCYETNPLSDVDVLCDEEIKNKILFEVYRREIILEFNSLLEKTIDDESDIVYGYTYTNLDSKIFTNIIENKLFICYASYDIETGVAGTRGDCTNNAAYGLTESDTWENIGIEFFLHSVVSSDTSRYYSSNAVPAGRYYVSSLISEQAQRNYKYNYLGGTLTIKTKTVGIVMNDYYKEYGDVFLKVENNASYSKCIYDGSLLKDITSSLISDCVDTNLVGANTSDNSYGFTIDGLVSGDYISDNFIGNPKRDTNIDVSLDKNALQENVGIYSINTGNVKSKKFNSGFNACDDLFKPSNANCVVVNGIDINNYMIHSDASYTLTYYLIGNKTSVDTNYASSAIMTIVNDSNLISTSGKLKIIPASITIEVTPNQTKMYGCAYNSLNDTSNYNYTYALGYEGCESLDGKDADLGYGYTVIGDRDYDINLNREIDYTDGTITRYVRDSREDINATISKNNALNTGSLIRIKENNARNVSLASLVSAGNNVQSWGQNNSPSHYQGQSVGSYVITLGNLDAPLTSLLSGYNEANNKVCNSVNEPGIGANYNLDCKNYIINYYGNTSVSEYHQYNLTDTNQADLEFVITKRMLFVVSEYNSKVYGNADPNITNISCDESMIDENYCSNVSQSLDYGIARYYTKNNSLAKSPWVASNENSLGIVYDYTSSNDNQVSVVYGSLTRYGMNSGVATRDDIVGVYNYKFDNVRLTDYALNNYNINYYYRELVDGKLTIDGSGEFIAGNEIISDLDRNNEPQAVDSDGNIEKEIDGIVKKIAFEINLRKIKVQLIDFAKVFGVEDNEMFFEVGVCASGDEDVVYDELGNPKCEFVDGKTDTQHGLSPSHKLRYLKEGGILNQSLFKQGFRVSFKRALGEYVGEAKSSVSGTLQGKFPSTDPLRVYDSEYEYNLGYDAGYQVLPIIDQSDVAYPGYNYEITYIIGTMHILQRNIEIRPLDNQGFMYGNYAQDGLIPAIEFSDSYLTYDYKLNYKVASYDASVDKLVIISRVHDGNTSKVETSLETNKLGLVNEGENSSCLLNIDGEDTFCINDKQTPYEELTYNTPDLLDNTLNRSGDDGLISYVFGDIYQNEGSTRSALNRSLGGNDNQRYNRNVGEYNIVIGDLLDKSGNYNINFVSGVKYDIIPATITITPDEGQGKVYGEADKEITFKVTTTYLNVTGVDASSNITIQGYAYDENAYLVDDSYNYGKVKISDKSGFVGENGILQNATTIGKSHDKYCYNNYTNNSIATVGIVSGCVNQNDIYFERTDRVLIGYLHLNNYIQSVGAYTISSGFVVSDNEFGNKNYLISLSSVTYTISKLNINIDIEDVSKTYGEATDSYKCDDNSNCEVSEGILNALDNENRLEYNFNIIRPGESEPIGVSGDAVLMVNSINGNYYTQTGGAEDKNNHLGLSVVREKGNDTCLYSGDMYGCEDVGTYKLVFMKESISGNVDNNYNLMIGDINVVLQTVSNIYLVVNITNNNIRDLLNITIIDNNNSLVINKRDVDIFVNTSLNNPRNENYYEIQQNIEVPNLPTINNSFDLLEYNFNPSGTYHDNMSSSGNVNPSLDTTYTYVVWGKKPNKVRTNDILKGELSYCNHPSLGGNYPSNYPGPGYSCMGDYVYNEDKRIVNTNTADKFIPIVRDTNSNKGLKILHSAIINGSNNSYEDKNYIVNFYPGAVHVISDDSAPVLTVNIKDYYIEANAKRDGENIIGSYDSIDLILQYLYNGDNRHLLIANVNNEGNLYINDSGEVTISSDSLQSKYGLSDRFNGIVTGSENTSVLPFVSNYANMHGGNPSYENEISMTRLQEVITTFIKWYGISSYDAGQYINGQYLERKFDKYYYIAINSSGYDIANNIDNTFAVNKVGSYDIHFYVMDNAGRVSGDGNIARLHIIDTTAPSGGELTLYNSEVKCDLNCNNKENFYINKNELRLNAFNRYRFDGAQYVLDQAGEYIKLHILGETEDIYTRISDLKGLNEETPRIETRNYIDYVILDDRNRYSSDGIEHYKWTSNETGIFATITGGRDNSYANIYTGESQWAYEYSLDGAYYVEYIVSNFLDGVNVLNMDGSRTITSVMVDYGRDKIDDSNSYVSVSYDTCYGNCNSIPIKMVNNVTIDGRSYEVNLNEISEASFVLGAYTCTISNNRLKVRCEDEYGASDYALRGNKLIVGSNIYTILDDIVLLGGDFVTRINRPSITIAGKTYYYNASYNSLYEEHLGFVTTLGNVNYLTIDGSDTYVLINNDLYRNEMVVNTIVDGQFEINGITYNFIPGYEISNSVIGGFFKGNKEYKISSSGFILGNNRDVVYSLQGFDSNNKKTIVVDGIEQVVSIVTSERYKHTFSEYDKYFIGIDNTSADVTPSELEFAFRNRVLANSHWNISSDEESINNELRDYLYRNRSEDYIVHKNQKVANLDKTSPNIGLEMTNNQNDLIVYGSKIEVYEYGYENMIRLRDCSLDNHNKCFMLGANRFEIDIDARSVNGLYSILDVDTPTDDKTYYFEIDYSKYYINRDISEVRWLHAYVEQFIGGKDEYNALSSSSSESLGTYDVNKSILIGGYNADTVLRRNWLNQITLRNSSGLSSSKYSSEGNDALYDFITTRENPSIYYEDIEYIVYVSQGDRITSFTLNEEIRTCHGMGEDRVRECIQRVIETVIVSGEDASSSNDYTDIVYNINYIIRDVAGNASRFESRGVIYASIYPSTRVIFNNIEPSNGNSGVSVVSLGDNEYSMVINQGVSLDLIRQAFSVNYGVSSIGSGYNENTKMTIYKGNELIHELVTGNDFTKYIDSSMIGDYTIVYTMSKRLDVGYDNEVIVNGDKVTLKLSIKSPDLDLNIRDELGNTINKNNNYLLISISLGITCLVLAGISFLIIKKKKR